MDQVPFFPLAANFGGAPCWAKMWATVLSSQAYVSHRAASAVCFQEVAALVSRAVNE